MTIDWTQSVETTEDPPRPVRVLATDLPCACPIVVLIDGNKGPSNVSVDGRVDGNCGKPYFRNVPPPKPEPVLREAWVRLFKDGSFTGFLSKPRLRIESTDYLETRRIAWMSDGSPVPGEASGEDTGCGLLRHVDDNGREDGHTLTMVSGGADYIGDFDTGFPRSLELCRMHDHNQTMAYVAAADRDHWKAKAEALQAEVDRMKPVVDSAVAWASQDQLGRLSHVRKAVRAYQTHRHPAEPAKN